MSPGTDFAQVPGSAAEEIAGFVKAVDHVARSQE